MAKIRAIKSIITGEEGESQPPEATEGTSSAPAGQKKSAVLALASEQPAGRSKKRPRKDPAGQSLADEDSTELAATKLGDQTEQPLGGPSKSPSSPPADMKKHDELSDLKVLHSIAKSIVLAAQKNYLAHERMIAVGQSLREAIAENKAQKVEIAKLKAAQEAVAAERDILSQKVDRADEDKQRAVKSMKARYLAELRKLRDANKVAMDKAVDDAEDRGYAQGEKTYERQVQATKDIFFQCGWKAAVEKVGLGQDADMFLNPPAAHIPIYMQAYASATQNRLIAEARKEAEEEAAAAQQAEQTTTEASQHAEDEVANREVAVKDGADDDAGKTCPSRQLRLPSRRWRQPSKPWTLNWTKDLPSFLACA
ncbi:uncharacterized protein LOC114296358 [Camellia sinensis]|uniref:uncharacterized protein LOC114296358 n=1 Tax=Camellia sinensis TaxID=4442 RepID=UPI00103645BE|nr:uncharacterized protein LOC114296358 [Camellia sinensis]